MINNVTLGRLGKPYHLYNAGEKGERANFSIAVESGRADNRKTSWMDVTLFGPAASTVAKNVTVGQELHVVGRIEPSNEGAKTADGYDRVVWQLVANSFDGVHFGRTRAAAVPATRRTRARARRRRTRSPEEIPF